MKKLYIGIDVHKIINHVSIAFLDMRSLTIYGKVKIDLT